MTNDAQLSWKSGFIIGTETGTGFNALNISTIDQFGKLLTVDSVYLFENIENLLCVFFSQSFITNFSSDFLFDRYDSE